MSTISEETERLLQVARTAPLVELVGFEGNLQFPRPSLEELCDLKYEPEKISRERRLVIEAYEARLTHNHVAEQRFAESNRQLDKKMVELLSRDK